MIGQGPKEGSFPLMCSLSQCMRQVRAESGCFYDTRHKLRNCLSTRPPSDFLSHTGKVWLSLKHDPRVSAAITQVVLQNWINIPGYPRMMVVCGMKHKHKQIRSWMIVDACFRLVVHSAHVFSVTHASKTRVFGVWSGMRDAVLWPGKYTGEKLWQQGTYFKDV